MKTGVLPFDERHEQRRGRRILCAAGLCDRQGLRSARVDRRADRLSRHEYGNNMPYRAALRRHADLSDLGSDHAADHEGRAFKSAAAECVSGAEESFAEENLTKACPEPPEQAVSAAPPPPQAAGVPVTAAGADGAQAKTTAAAPNAAESEKIVNPKRGRKCRGPKRRDRRPQELRN